MQKVCMIGSGYVGLVTGVCLADFGNSVTCVDLDEEKIELLRAGKMPFYEFALEEIVNRNVREGRLNFTSDLPKAIRDNRVIFIAVGTPQSETGEADLSQVWSAAKTIAKNLNGYKLIVQKSTVPVGTGERVWKIIEASRPRKSSVRRGEQPRVPPRRIGRRGLHAPRPGRDRHLDAEGGDSSDRDLPAPLPQRDPDGPHERAVRRVDQVRIQRLPLDEDLLHQRDGEPLRGRGRRREGHRPRDGPRQADRAEVPARRARGTAVPVSRRTRSPLRPWLPRRGARARSSKRRST